jgi:hypothetical protein
MRDVGRVLEVLHHLVNGDGADRHRRGVHDRQADGVDVAAGGQVHDGVGAEVDGGVQLLQFVVDGAGDGRVADVGVDLAGGGDADRHRLQPLRQVDRVGRDDHPAAGHLVADQVSVEVLAAGNVTHLVRDDAPAGGFELGHDELP